MTEIMRQEGLKGLYRSIIPELLKVTPIVSIAFCAYEMTLALLIRFYEPDSML